MRGAHGHQADTAARGWHGLHGCGGGSRADQLCVVWAGVWCSHTADRQCLCSDPLRCVGVWTFFLSIRIHTAADWLPKWLPRVHPPPCFPHAYGLSARSSTSLVMKGSAVRVRSSASLIPPAFPHYHGRYRHPARLGVIVRNRPEPTPSVTEWTAAYRPTGRVAWDHPERSPGIEKPPALVEKAGTLGGTPTLNRHSP